MGWRVKHFGRLATVALILALAQGAIAGSSEWVEGLGWVPSTVVTDCLGAVGAVETDELHDAQWDDFFGCVGNRYRP